MVTNLKVQESPLNFLMDDETIETTEEEEAVVTIEEMTEIEVIEETEVVSVIEEEEEIVILVEEENSVLHETPIIVALFRMFHLAVVGKILKITSVKQEMYALQMYVETEMVETWGSLNLNVLMILNGHSKN